ncbi:MAG: HD domain-containing protein [Desulfobacteraceae bacterium]|nr:HD domain-containing protein [Desulfobacteraceae bacterium]
MPTDCQRVPPGYCYKALEQKIFTREQTIKKTRTYLDRFKHTLFAVKTELTREKTSLNNALKQIHHMTKERNQLKYQVQRIKQTLAQNMDGFEKLLASLIRSQVETSRGHGERVAHIACFVGKGLGFDEKKLENLHKAGMLHEIGLVFMPRTGVTKSFDQLTTFEKNMQDQYPVKGADLLSHCNAFEKVAQIIRYMHENVDGTGFPRGLKKNYIPMASRVLAGADLCDTLKNGPKICALEDLMAALENAAGSRLDPLVVNWLEKYALLHMGSDAFQVRGVGMEALVPGMRLGCALCTSTGTKLFSADTVLTQKAIDKIIQYSREFPVDDILYIKV